MAEVTLSAEEVARQLPHELRLLLADLLHSSDKVAEITMGLCRLSSRAALVACGAIIAVSPHDRPNDEPVQEVELTGFGRELIVACDASLSVQE